MKKILIALFPGDVWYLKAFPSRNMMWGEK
jgi:hypothetical protein